MEAATLLRFCHSVGGIGATRGQKTLIEERAEHILTSYIEALLHKAAP